MAWAREQAGPPTPPPLGPLAFVQQGTWRGKQGTDEPQVLLLISSLEWEQLWLGPECHPSS